MRFIGQWERAGGSPDWIRAAEIQPGAPRALMAVRDGALGLWRARIEIEGQLPVSAAGFTGAAAAQAWAEEHAALMLNALAPPLPFAGGGQR